jgi:hypothetical protein
MPLTVDQLNALADDSRKQTLRQKVAKLQGEVLACSSLMQAVNGVSTDAQAQLSLAQTQLSSLETTSGDGVTDTFGPLSTTDQALRSERYSGKAALVDYVKAHPSCAESDALAAYRTAALAARPADQQWLIQDITGLRQQYSFNLVAAKLISDTTWASFAAWIVATPKDTILGL